MQDLVKIRADQKRITIKEMAQRLNRCEKTFRKYVIEYKIPHIRLGRDMLFNADEVESYLLNLTMKSADSLSDASSAKTKAKTNKSLKHQDKSKNKYAKLLGIS